MHTKVLRAWTTFLFVLAAAAGAAHADFTKTIQASPGVTVQAVATFDYITCDESGGLGSYSITVAPKFGTLSFSTVNGIVPGCPTSSPTQPAAAAFYTLNANATVGQPDYFQLFYSGPNGTEYLDITVNPAVLIIAPTTLPSTTSGDPYSVQFTTSNAQGPVKWSLLSGTLPAGFSFSDKGLLSSTGSPAAAPEPSLTSPGPYTFTVLANDTINTSTQPLTLTVLTPDCSTKVSIILDNLVVTPKQKLDWDTDAKSLYLTSGSDYAGIVKLPFFGELPPWGISINANTAVGQSSSVSLFESPKIAFINNMAANGWTGSATYGIGRGVVEKTAEIGQTDTVGNPIPGGVNLPLLDSPTSPWSVPTGTNNPWLFYDSPNAVIPLLDSAGRPLSRVSYKKSFTTYVACYFDSDDVPHPIATVNWTANYSGNVYMLGLFGVYVPQTAGFFEDPGPAVTYTKQSGATQTPVVNGPLTSCHQTYENFPGSATNVPWARCTP